MDMGDSQGEAVAQGGRLQICLKDVFVFNYPCLGLQRNQPLSTSHMVALPHLKSIYYFPATFHALKWFSLLCEKTAQQDFILFPWVPAYSPTSSPEGGTLSLTACPARSPPGAALCPQPPKERPLVPTSHRAASGPA